MHPTLVALDIDGTLVDPSNVVAPEVREAIHRAARSARVMLCTGRSWHATLSVLQQLDLPPTEHVCSNGAVTVLYPPVQIGEIRTFDPTEVIQRIAAEHPAARLAVEVVGVGYRVTEEFPVGELSGEIEVVPVDELAGGDVTRLIVRDPEASEEEFIELAERVGLEGVSYAVGHTAWLDIAPEGIDKAHALERVCGRLGIPAAHVLAVGDGRNDVAMLRWAGRGVAMAHAPDEVLEVADAVTGTVEDGGLVAELNRWF